MFCATLNPVITTGLMLRSDKLGVASIIRDLALNPGCYDSMLHFFRASSWSLENIRTRWFSAVRQYALLYKEGNLHVLVGKISSSQIRYQRTPSRGRVSEATLMHYFRKHYFRLLEQKPKSYITQIIQELQEEPEEQWDSLAS